MSVCDSCKLYRAEDTEIPELFRCEGDKSRDDCVCMLQSYIEDLEIEIKKKTLALNELIWRWKPVWPGMLVSSHDNDHDWYICHVPHGKYEIGCLPKGNLDFEKNAKRLAMAFFLPAAKMWVYENYIRFKKGDVEKI